MQDYTLSISKNIMDCIFCKIIEGKIPAPLLFEDSELIVFNDIEPQAPTHCLIIPKRHISTINEATAEDERLLGHMILTGQKTATELDIAQSGYRLIFNVNRGGGQQVYHIHLHLLGGRNMTWPPG